MRISDWSSDVCSSDLGGPARDRRSCRPTLLKRQDARGARNDAACVPDRGRRAVARQTKVNGGIAARPGVNHADTDLVGAGVGARCWSTLCLTSGIDYTQDWKRQSDLQSLRHITYA